jgi:membrane glycosyltransferase
MRSDAKRGASETDADGTEVEENRQLTKLLLENSVAYDSGAPKSSFSTIESGKTTVLEVIVLLALAPLFCAHSLIIGNSMVEFEEAY